MAAASISTEGFGLGLAHHNKLTKSRNRTVVKPILKKLHSSSSDNTSLDLDRGWDEQAVRYYDQAVDDAAPSTRPSVRDVSFSRSATSLTASGPIGSDATSRRRNGNQADKFSHARSTSGASHASVTTNGSGRNGSFVHPFQQTSRCLTRESWRTTQDGRCSRMQPHVVLRPGSRDSKPRCGDLMLKT